MKKRGLMAKKKTTINKEYVSGIGNNKQVLMKALKLMMTARQIDAKAMTLLKQGKTFFHIAGSGHEGIQAAIGLQLHPTEDWYFPYYRDLTIALSAGVTNYDFFLQCFGKAADPACGGRQLPGHWGTKKPVNIPAQSSPTGTQFLQAVGTALASERRGIRNVSYVASGEGTTSQGEFHEAVNWASREKLPVLFCIQNNKYAISVPVSQQSGGKSNSIAEMMAGYDNLKRYHIDGTDFVTAYQSVTEGIEYIKSGKGPVLIEADVVRLESHSSSDDHKKYRSIEEIERDKERCPISRLSSYLLHHDLATAEEIDDLRQLVIKEINEAAELAEEEKNPEPETAHRYVFDESGYKESLTYEKSKPVGKSIVMVDAINHALHEELRKNPDIYVFGEDIADGKGGVFTATKGLSTTFGSKRVFNSPLAEASIAGVAAGMALAGMRPVVEIQFGDYIWPAFMQYKCEIATIRYRSNDAWNAPVVTRVAVGGYIHGGLYHSQNIESIFAHIPGIYIAYPSNANDAKGLLKTAMRINDPVLFCEHKGLYRQPYAATPEPDEDFLIPFGKANIVREGTDATIVTYGLNVWDAYFISKRLEEEGYSIEIIDIRTIAPLDEETIFNSVKKTNKVIVIHEDTLTAGFGGEIAARIADGCFRHLDAPVKRLAAMDSHIPYSPVLEDTILPSREETYKAIKELLLY